MSPVGKSDTVKAKATTGKKSSSSHGGNTFDIEEKSDNKTDANESDHDKTTTVKPANPSEPSIPEVEVTPSGNGFTDVADGAYYKEAVDWAVQNEITAGTSATTFSPEALTTRAQAVTFLWRQAGSPAPKVKDMPFVDVAEDAYYRDAVLWAVEAGITSGTSETTFSPDMACSRAQIVSFLYREAGKPVVEASNPFSDVSPEDFFASAVLWAVNAGMTAGTSDTTFSPDMPCSRAQIATFLYRQAIA